MQPAFDFSPLDPDLNDSAGQDFRTTVTTASKQSSGSDRAFQEGSQSDYFYNKDLRSYPYLTWDAANPSEQRQATSTPRFSLAKTVTSRLFRRNSHQTASQGLKRSRSTPGKSSLVQSQDIPSGLSLPFPGTKDFEARQTSAPQQWFQPVSSDPDLQTPTALTTPKANIQSWTSALQSKKSLSRKSSRQAISARSIDSDRPYISGTSSISLPFSESSGSASKSDLGKKNSRQNIHLEETASVFSYDYFSRPVKNSEITVRSIKQQSSLSAIPFLSGTNQISGSDLSVQRSPEVSKVALESSTLTPCQNSVEFLNEKKVQRPQRGLDRTKSFSNVELSSTKKTVPIATDNLEEQHPFAFPRHTGIKRSNSDCTDRSSKSGKEFLNFKSKPEPLVLRISAPQANRLVGLITSASNPNPLQEEASKREEPLVSFSILKPIPTDVTTTDMAIGENSGGGWLSRLGGGGNNSKQRQTNGGQQNEGTANDSALLNRFMLDKKPSNENFRSGGASSPRNTANDKLDLSTSNGRNVQQEREMAAQHIARQQRTANDAKLAANMIPLLDGVTHMPQHPNLPPSSSPHARLEQYRQATRNPTGLPGIERSKIDRVLAQGSDSSHTRKSSNTTDANSSYEDRSRTMSDSGPEEVTCPVCLELLSFRLAGEKAHVVPLCGHALHHACFTAVYGSVQAVLQAQSSQGGKHSPPGMCGVCRRLIVLGEDRGDGKKGSKAAGVMGVGNGDSYSDDRSMVSTHVSDDPLEMVGLHQSSTRVDEAHQSLDKSRYNTGAVDEGRGGANRNRFMLLPTVKVRPEFETVYRKERKDAEGTQQGRQNIVCVVTVEIPSRRQIERMEEDETHWRHRSEQFRPDIIYENKDKGKSKMIDGHDENNDYEDDDHNDPNLSFNRFVKNSHLQFLNSNSEINSSRERQDLPEQDGRSDDEEEGFSFSATPAANVRGDLDEAVDDLRNRIIDWKGHSVERFGALSLYDYLGVCQESIVRDFYVYLFKDALLCVNEERKKEKSFARLIHADRSDDSGSPLSSSGRKSRAPLKLKGRIWLRHIRSCQDTEIDGMPCLSIRLDDEALDNFVLSFREQSLRETWRMKLNELLTENRARNKKTGVQNVQRSQNGNDSNGMGRKMPESPLTQSSYGDASLSSMATRNTSNDVSLTSSHNSGQYQSNHSDRPNGHQNGVQSILTGVPSHQQWSASGGLDPNVPVPALLPHTPIDLVIMVSVPSVTVQPSVSSSTLSSSAALKVRLIRSTLDFVITHMGPRDRISIVAYHVGIEGVVRRTALLNTSKPNSIEKLEQFVDSIGKPWEGPGPDPFREDIDRLGGNSERTDTVTAVNVGFDIILQRKSKNPITGMLLINDTADAPKRGQMDLVMARAEAANVPVHCFGFGKSHDPSSLWLISNHTHGSYTFVREWYQLRECVTGCIGALMSIALTDVRLHISVPSDNHFRVRKVTGCTGSIIASNGKDVDLDLGELRFGENREIFFELELDFAAYMMQNDLTRRNQHTAMQSPYEKGSATDDFMMRLGLKGLSLTDQDDKQSLHNSSTSDSRSHHSGGSDGNFVDEIAVLEVQCGCRDPSIGMGASRLPDPCVLTIEIDSSTNDPAADGNGASGLATALADPVVTRRRLEILVSDMITRCLLLVSRRNHAQALTILLETRKIVDTVLQAIPLLDNSNNVHPNRAVYPTRRSSLRLSSFSNKQPSKASIYATQTRSSQARKQRERLHKRTAAALMAILDDLDVLIDGLELGKAMSFDRSERNFGAQQAMVLRDQKAWTSRSDTEWQFFKTLDNGSSFAALAAQFAAGYSR